MAGVLVQRDSPVGAFCDQLQWAAALLGAAKVLRRVDNGASVAGLIERLVETCRTVLLYAALLRAALARCLYAVLLDAALLIRMRRSLTYLLTYLYLLTY